jgi:hypothetical protein
MAAVAAGCDFKPTAPFSGFDNQGTRVTGLFQSGGGSSQSAQIGAPAAVAGVQGIEVSLRERPSLKATVDQNGVFTLTGVPSGSFTIVFVRDGRTLGEIRIEYVRENQGIRITVVLTSLDEVVLVKEERDQVSFAEHCPRGPGFWCQNQGGKNPNLAQDEFEAFASEAATLLQGVETLNTSEEIAPAVCETRDQFQRQLAALALNLAADTVTKTTVLEGEQNYTTVGGAFDAAVASLTGTSSLSSSERDALKDVMDRINNAQNVPGCDALPDDDDDDTTGDDPTQPPPTGSLTICHIPPGNFNARHTITIDASAWPAHMRHCAQNVCDSQGACR